MDQFGFFEIFAAGLALFYSFIKSYGLAIILLTLLVRLILLPLSIKQTRSMREMAVIQPEVKKIQAKHKGNRQKMNEEMMALYKEHGVNPLGGCLPLLLQFPILIALFQVLRSPLKYLGESTSLTSALQEMPLAVNRFLGLRLDCTPMQVVGQQPSDFIGDVNCSSSPMVAIPYFLIILVIGATTYYQQKQMQARQPDSPQAQQMQAFAKVMPLIFMAFSLTFPTGMAIYFLTTNLWTIVQQRIILAAAPLPEPVPTKGGSKKTKGETAAKSGKNAGKAATKARSDGKAAKAAGGTKGTGSGSAKGRSNPSGKKKRR